MTESAQPPGVVVEESEEDDHASRSRIGPFLVGTVMVLGGIVLLWQVTEIPGEGFDPSGPRFFPLLIVLLWLALAVIYLVLHTIGVARGDRGEPADRFGHVIAAVSLLALLVVYAFVLDLFGYWIATSAFFIAAARILGSRNLIRDAVVGLLLSLAVYLAFTGPLGVRLPEGILPF